MRNCSNKECINKNPQFLQEFYTNSSRKDGLDHQCKTCNRMRSKIRKNRPEGKIYMKNWSLKDRYGITIELFQKMLEKQNNKCLICESNFKNQREIHTDHDHTTKIVRGLLCINCNKGLGHFKDNINSLKNAIKYLKPL